MSGTGAADEGRRPPLILVVDDEPGVLPLVRYLLVTSGYACLTARTASDALGLAVGVAPIDLLLVDTDLPGTPVRDLVDRFRVVSPRTRVLCTPKPLAAGFLLNAVRDALARRDP